MTLVDLDFNLLDGKRARGCPHMAEWAPVYRRYLIFLGVIKNQLDCVQAAGGYSKSGGTHEEGTALDLVGPEVCAKAVIAARNGGARAAWIRGPFARPFKAAARALGFSNHLHLAIDCPCVSGADYQLTEADQGYDGLVGNGRDYHSRPSARRNYKQGIAWMEAQMKETARPFDFVAFIWSMYTGKPTSHLKLARSWIGSKSTGKTWNATDMAAYQKLTGKKRPTPTDFAPIAAKHNRYLTSTSPARIAAAVKASLAALRKS